MTKDIFKMGETLPCRTCPTLAICTGKVKKERTYYSKQYMETLYVNRSATFFESDLEFISIENALNKCPIIQEYSKHNKAKAIDCLQDYYFGELEIRS